MALAGYCVDSDILIDHLRGVDDARLFLLEASNQYPLFISTVSIVELYSGQSTRQKRIQRELEQFLGSFNPIHLTPALAQVAGELRRDYHRPFADMIVAASAIKNNLTLVTRNEKDY